MITAADEGKTLLAMEQSWHCLPVVSASAQGAYETLTNAVEPMFGPRS